MFSRLRAALSTARSAQQVASHSDVLCIPSQWSQSLACLRSVATLHTSANSSPHGPHLSPPDFGTQRGGYFQSGQAKRCKEVPRYLVTGAGGQVGAELVPYLRKRIGYENVFSSDVRSSSTMAPFVYCDVTDKDSLSRVVMENRITHIVHLATLLSAIGEINPRLALRVNAIGIQNVLEVAVQNKLKVFAPSTIAVFGSSTPRDMVPNSTICEPSTMYGITKVHQELLGQYYANKFGLDFRSLRYPGIISSAALPGGGTTDYAMEMYMNAAKQRPYKCFIDRNTHLPMMYMPDCLRATWELMQVPRESLSRCTYNVTAMTFAPTELEASIRVHCPDFEVTYDADFRQKIANTWPRSIDDGLATKDWGWKPEYCLESMTTDMIRKLGFTGKGPGEGGNENWKELEKMREPFLPMQQAI